MVNKASCVGVVSLEELWDMLFRGEPQLYNKVHNVQILCPPQTLRSRELFEFLNISRPNVAEVGRAVLIITSAEGGYFFHFGLSVCPSDRDN